MSNIIKKLLIDNRRFTRILFFLAFDVIFITLAVFSAFYLRFEGDIPARYFSNIEGMIVLALVVTLPIFYFSRLYSFAWIYVSTAELVALVRAVFFSFVVLASAILLLRDHPVFVGFPRSTLFISYFLIFIFSGGTRFAKRILLNLRAFPGFRKGKRERTLIIGAGDAGEQILRSILGSPGSLYLPIGFIDDNLSKKGIFIHGQKILGSISEIPKIVKEKKVEGLIVALPSAGSSIIRNAVEQGRKAGLRKIKILPPMSEVIDGKIKVGIGALQEIEMEDLLGREPVSLDQKSIKDFIGNKKVLVTGAAGSIGSELCRQIAKFNPQTLFLLDQDETGIFDIENELKEKFPNVKVESFVADVRDEGRIDRIFNHCYPNIVLHAAAYKHVPLMESENNIEEAVKNNVTGTRIVVRSAARSGETEKFIFISTDKAVNPSSVMGATKRVGEMICQVENQEGKVKFISVRFGNVLGSRGSVIPVFQQRIKNREPIEITHSDMKRYFMTTPEACLLVLQAGAMGQGGEVFVLDMGDPVKIMDLARELIQLSGLEPDKDVPIVFSEPRPGEKFSEELLTAEEGVLATQNQKIFTAKLSTINQENLYSGIESP
ncbi:MAG: nucleoside-diphosphate sugar epimerase/dehydratase, partial [bacterium]|nr:nucleoside-diphosphate sugar epimerase/dehydratase [bacterium]